jgi:hypothetical protein
LVETSEEVSHVDIDYEDSSGFTGSYDGIGFLTTLTSALAEALPSGQNIVTHAPQTPYWDSCWNNAPYAQIWQQVGNQIAWINKAGAWGNGVGQARHGINGRTFRCLLPDPRARTSRSITFLHLRPLILDAGNDLKADA